MWIWRTNLRWGSMQAADALRQSLEAEMRAGQLSAAVKQLQMVIAGMMRGYRLTPALAAEEEEPQRPGAEEEEPQRRRLAAAARVRSQRQEGGRTVSVSFREPHPILSCGSNSKPMRLCWRKMRRPSTTTTCTKL